MPHWKPHLLWRGRELQGLRRSLCDCLAFEPLQGIPKAPVPLSGGKSVPRGLPSCRCGREPHPGSRLAACVLREVCSFAWAQLRQSLPKASLTGVSPWLRSDPHCLLLVAHLDEQDAWGSGAFMLLGMIATVLATSPFCDCRPHRNNSREDGLTLAPGLRGCNPSWARREAAAQ